VHKYTGITNGFALDQPVSMFGLIGDGIAQVPLRLWNFRSPANRSIRDNFFPQRDQFNN
jgi:hypothetical protein